MNLISLSRHDLLVVNPINLRVNNTDPDSSAADDDLHDLLMVNPKFYRVNNTDPDSSAADDEKWN